MCPRIKTFSKYRDRQTKQQVLFSFRLANVAQRTGLACCGRFISKSDIFLKLKQVIKAHTSTLALEKEKASLQTTVATLLLITAAVVLTCVVIDYAVSVVQTTLQTTNIPQLDRLKNIQSSILNQTDTLYNQTQLTPQNIGCTLNLTVHLFFNPDNLPLAVSGWTNFIKRNVAESIFLGVLN